MLYYIGRDYRVLLKKSLHENKSSQATISEEQEEDEYSQFGSGFLMKGTDHPEILVGFNLTYCPKNLKVFTAPFKLRKVS